MVQAQVQVGKRLKSFFGLSRMSHSVLDVAHPAVGALLVLGAMPRLSTALIGLCAAFAGYTAVFALNDVMDCPVDCEKLSLFGKEKECFDLDSVGDRHPLAQGQIRFSAAVGWVVFWGLLALVLAFLLNPVCALLMSGAVVLELSYCRLLRVTHWKTLLSGAMVAVGGLAGVFAVQREPSLPLVVLFLTWAFAWEMGCRNIPNDWSDLEEDSRLGIRTVPVRYGQRASSWISFAFQLMTVVAGLAMGIFLRSEHLYIFLAGALAAGVVFIVAPGALWVRRQTTRAALSFFNRACFYPLAVCLIAGVALAV